MFQIEPSKIHTKKLHQYLLSIVGPRPIALASTIDLKRNISDYLSRISIVNGANSKSLPDNKFLNKLRKEKVMISVFLINGIKLDCIVEAFDPYTILLKSKTTQSIYKHAISTIVPHQHVKLEIDD